MIKCSSNLNKFQIKLKEHLLCQTETHKYLGIIIDEKLSWKPHLSAVASKLAKLCGIFYKLRLYVDKQVLKKVYYTLIYPILLYGVICWGSCSKTVFKPVEVAHNRILRCINMVGKRQIHVTDLYALSNVGYSKYMTSIFLKYVNLCFVLNMICCQMSFQNIFLNTIQFITITPEILLKVIISYQESKRQLV